jgi:hypothetical protein
MIRKSVLVLAAWFSVAAIAAIAANTEARELGSKPVGIIIPTKPVTSALQNNDGDPGCTSEDCLVGNGYTCVHVATGFDDCTKDGSPEYWCDGSGTCGPAPSVKNPKKVIGPTTVSGTLLNAPTSAAPTTVAPSLPASEFLQAKPSLFMLVQ